jgi:hypothetical protein
VEGSAVYWASKIFNYQSEIHDRPGDRQQRVHYVLPNGAMNILNMYHINTIFNFLVFNRVSTVVDNINITHLSIYLFYNAGSVS